MQDYMMPERNFTENKRTEIHDGKIYYMAGTSMPHNEITANVLAIFKNYLKGKKCRVYGENANVIFKKGFRRFMPDVKIVCDPDKIKKDGIYGAPDLIVEILSPGTEAIDFGYKKDIYEENGVKEYWIVNPDAKSITVYLLKDCKYEIGGIYREVDDDEYENLDSEEKENIKFEFKTSLDGYDDLVIKTEDVFENVD